MKHLKRLALLSLGLLSLGGLSFGAQQVRAQTTISAGFLAMPGGGDHEPEPCPEGVAPAEVVA